MSCTCIFFFFSLYYFKLLDLSLLRNRVLACVSFSVRTHSTGIDIVGNYRRAISSTVDDDATRLGKTRRRKARKIWKKKGTHNRVTDYDTVTRNNRIYATI